MLQITLMHVLMHDIPPWLHSHARSDARYRLVPSFMAQGASAQCKLHRWLYFSLHTHFLRQKWVLPYLLNPGTCASTCWQCLRAALVIPADADDVHRSRSSYFRSESEIQPRTPEGRPGAPKGPSPKSSERQERMQRVKRMQMAQFMDQLTRTSIQQQAVDSPSTGGDVRASAAGPASPTDPSSPTRPPSGVSSPNRSSSIWWNGLRRPHAPVKPQMAPSDLDPDDLPQVASLTPSGAGPGPSEVSPDRNLRKSASGRPPIVPSVGRLRETPSMVWARLQRAPSPPSPAAVKPLETSMSSVWAQIHAVCPPPQN